MTERRLINHPYHQMDYQLMRKEKTDDFIS